MKLERQSQITINYKLDGVIDRDACYLLFNGATLPLTFWGSIPEALASVRAVLRFDQRNAGKTVAPGVFTLNDIAADANALMLKHKFTKAIVVGHAWEDGWHRCLCVTMPTWWTPW